MNTPAFTRTVEDLYGLMASAVTVVLCAEQDYRRCHRLYLSDKLLAMGARVTHILDVATAEDHSYHPDLVVEEDKLYYRRRQLDLLSQ